MKDNNTQNNPGKIKQSHRKQENPPNQKLKSKWSSLSDERH
jgi:hypothetical protein